MKIPEFETKKEYKNGVTYYHLFVDGKWDSVNIDKSEIEKTKVEITQGIEKFNNINLNEL